MAAYPVPAFARSPTDASDDNDDEKFYDANETIISDDDAVQNTTFRQSSVTEIYDGSDSGDDSEDSAEIQDAAAIAQDNIDSVATIAADVADEKRNQVVNLDTGEIFAIEKLNPPTDTFHTVREAEPPPDVDEKEILKKKIRTGFISKMLHRSVPSDVLISNQIKVKTHKKTELDISGLKNVQTLLVHHGPIWTMKWTVCGNYLATAGQDAIIRLWLVNGGDAKPDEEHVERSSPASVPSSDPYSHSVFMETPHRVYAGHKSDIIDLAWSKSSFLLSASMDKSVRLWHVSKNQCLSSFQHADFVTSVAFHPSESRKFLSGSFDKKLRMWDILDHRVVDWAQTSTMITAAAFNQTGKLAVAGLYNGQVMFYQSQGLTYFTQIDCRNRKGKHKRGRKVTGLQFSNDGQQILISTNDSRIRLYDMDDYSMSMKYKGHENETLQIRAHFSEDNKFIISGSDDSDVFVWPTNKDCAQSLKRHIVSRDRDDRNDSYEYFKAHNGIVTVALMAPEKTCLFATRAWPQGGEIRHLIVAAGYDGRIKIFENRGDPVQLKQNTFI